MNNISKGILGIATAGVLALSFAGPASAARLNRGGAVAAGAAAGFVAGAAIASQPRYYYRDGGYAPSYGYVEDYSYPAGPSSRWYNGRYDSNGVNNN